jgi:endonuclease/exonuclease/phosphatase (EEP) superfamily protein YafD
MQTGNRFSNIRKLAGVSLVVTSASLVYGCASLSIPHGMEVVHHRSETARTFTIDAIRQCIEQNCRVARSLVAPQELDPDRISILNWNIYKSRRENWMADFDEFSRGQDIVIIQEAMLHSNLTESLNAQRFNWDLSTGFEYKNVATGVLTASHVKAASQSGLRMTEPILRLPKTTLISRYDLRGTPKQLLVANIHGINFTLGRRAYSAQIRALQAMLEQHDGPIILAGDFNSWNDQRQRIISQMTERLSLQSLRYENHKRTRIFGREIDHVFYRGLEPLKIETRDVTSSDHKPIMVTFRIPPLARNIALETESTTMHPATNH